MISKMYIHIGRLCHMMTKGTPRAKFFDILVELGSGNLISWPLSSLISFCTFFSPYIPLSRSLMSLTAHRKVTTAHNKHSIGTQSSSRQIFCPGIGISDTRSQQRSAPQLTTSTSARVTSSTPGSSTVASDGILSSLVFS
jgi:hypothetical protein